MTTPQLDEIPLPRFEDRLWAELARLHGGVENDGSGDGVGDGDGGGTGDTANPDEPADSPPTNVSALRGRARRSLIAGLGAAAAAAVVAAAVALTGPDGRTDPGSHADAPPADDPPADGTPAAGDPYQPLDADLATQMIAALQSTVVDAIEHSYPEGAATADPWKTWIDEQSGTMRILQLSSSGEPVLDTGPATPPGVGDVSLAPSSGGLPGDPSWPTVPVRTVDYCFGEYSDGPRGLLPARNTARDLRDKLERGLTYTDGTQVVDGRELIRVFWAIELTEELVPDPGTWTPPPEMEDVELAPGGGAVVFTDQVLLVDPTTFRPALAVSTRGQPGAGATRFEYLPRTPENLALLSPPVPDGFVPRDMPRGDGEIFERCGTP